MQRYEPLSSVVTAGNIFSLRAFSIYLNIMEDIRKRFLTKTEDTGRFIIKSLVTGKEYFVEPLDNGVKTDWGDLNPATKKMEGEYGMKHKGSVNEKDSLITKENGFDNIVTLPPGYSPIEYIEHLDKMYEEKIKSRK